MISIHSKTNNEVNNMAHLPFSGISLENATLQCIDCHHEFTLANAKDCDENKDGEIRQTESEWEARCPKCHGIKFFVSFGEVHYEGYDGY